MICKFGIELCYVSLREFQIRGRRICWRHCSNNSGSLPLTPSGRSSLKSVDQNTTHSRNSCLEKDLSSAMHHRLSCIPARRGFPAIYHQKVCSSLKKRAGFALLRCSSMANGLICMNLQLSAITFKVEMTLTIQVLTTSLM
ncbi:uncharacterized protein LOC126616300 [Malus sylvestris]|uniref:uncharacterized protein LOC126616300 n=1 Tax=Malus sylvestris TaxID=3752 RepID=UPI0021AC1F01|nr:uncharacterized protein LOC126616300 [Malus sylvestris]